MLNSKIYYVSVFLLLFTFGCDSDPAADDEFPTPEVVRVDDLPAELDADNRKRVLTQLNKLQAQLFVTSVEQSALELGPFEGAEIATFHVERGTIRG